MLLNVDLSMASLSRAVQNSLLIAGILCIGISMGAEIPADYSPSTFLRRYCNVEQFRKIYLKYESARQNVQAEINRLESKIEALDKGALVQLRDGLSTLGAAGSGMVNGAKGSWVSQMEDSPLDLGVTDAEREKGDFKGAFDRLAHTIDQKLDALLKEASPARECGELKTKTGKVECYRSQLIQNKTVLYRLNSLSLRIGGNSVGDCWRAGKMAAKSASLSTNSPSSVKASSNK